MMFIIVEQDDYHTVSIIVLRGRACGSAIRNRENDRHKTDCRESKNKNTNVKRLGTH